VSAFSIVAGAALILLAAVGLFALWILWIMTREY
jgi:hypothetical protein